MRAARWWVGGALAVSCLGAAAAEGVGLAVSADSGVWPRWQGRLFVDTTAPVWRAELAGIPGGGLKVQGLGVMGDYYFASLPLGAKGSGGFRATSGILFGTGRSSFRAAPPDAASATSLVNRHDRLRLGAVALEEASDSQTVPYVGVGYSGLSAGSGWGFAADVGVMAVGSGSGLRPGRTLDGAQNVDEVLRDLRMTPVVQLGISYSF